MVLTNLQGTIVSNLVCGLIGGPGLTAGANYGPKYALFEPGTRNTGTKLAGQNVANPIAMLTASVELLKHIEMKQHAEVTCDFGNIKIRYFSLQRYYYRLSKRLLMRQSM